MMQSICQHPSTSALNRVSTTLSGADLGAWDGFHALDNAAGKILSSPMVTEFFDLTRAVDKAFTTGQGLIGVCYNMELNVLFPQISACFYSVACLCSRKSIFQDMPSTEVLLLTWGASFWLRNPQAGPGRSATCQGSRCALCKSSRIFTFL